MSLTEAEWESCKDPEAMLDFLRMKREVSDRKLRLFACACAHLVWDNVQVWGTPDEEVSRKTVSTSERFADGVAGNEDLSAARAELAPVLKDLRTAEEAMPRADDLKGKVRAVRLAAATAQQLAKRAAEVAASEVGWDRWSRWVFQGWASPVSFEMHREGLTALLREIFGPLPFRSIYVEPAWRTPKVLALAQTSYDQRAFDRLPELVSALEDAGCTDSELVRHLHGPGAHVRGCWVIDLLLSKE